MQAPFIVHVQGKVYIESNSGYPKSDISCGFN